MPVLVQSHVRTVQFNRKWIVRLAQALLTRVGESAAELGLVFVGDRRMRRLNRVYRHKDRTTDVLAFALREAVPPRVLGRASAPLGDVVISIPTALRQAKESRRSLDHEIAVLMIHGILHLCGYDHERSRAEARRMQRRERSLLAGLEPIPRLVARVTGR